MTKEKLKLEAQAILDTLGVKIDEITDEIAQEIVSWKADLDTETRREVREKCAVIGVAACILCYFLGAVIGF